MRASVLATFVVLLFAASVHAGIDLDDESLGWYRRSLGAYYNIQANTDDENQYLKKCRQMAEKYLKEDKAGKKGAADLARSYALAGIFLARYYDADREDMSFFHSAITDPYTSKNPTVYHRQRMLNQGLPIYLKHIDNRVYYFNGEDENPLTVILESFPEFGDSAIFTLNTRDFRDIYELSGNDSKTLLKAECRKIDGVFECRTKKGLEFGAKPDGGTLVLSGLEKAGIPALKKSLMDKKTFTKFENSPTDKARYILKLPRVI